MTPRKFTQAILLTVLLSSCVNTRKAVYFNGQGDARLPSNIAVSPTVFIPNDLISITVTSLNPNASAVFNAPNVTYPNNTTNITGGPVQISGYLVDAEGNIQFPVLGTLKAAGLTEAQLREQISKGITDKKLLLDPIVAVRHLNFKVTVLGEVGHPTVINVPSEKITLLEALGLAGDVTVYGRKDNILVVREEGGQKLIKRLDLNSSEIFSSPYYYLHANDIVYVEPNKARVAGSSRTFQLLPIILSGLSFAAIIIDRIVK